MSYHHPKSTSSSSAQLANAKRPIDDSPCDFHKSIETIDLLYCDIVMATSSMFMLL